MLLDLYWLSVCQLECPDIAALNIWLVHLIDASKTLTLSNCLCIFLPTSSALWQLILFSSTAVKPDDKEHSLCSFTLNGSCWLNHSWILVRSFKSRLLLEIPKSTFSFVLCICIGGHSIMNPSTFMHAVNLLQENWLCHSSSPCKSSTTLDWSHHDLLNC